MIYFTSDTHFGHKNIINLCDRPFRNEMGEPDIELMNATLINNWNKVITPEDEVYFMGDFAFMGKNRTQDVLDKLVGKIYFIWGNHDDRKIINSVRDRFVWIKDYHELWHNHIDGNKYHFVLFHYPIQSWDRMFHGSIHLHGHQHRVDQSDRTNKILDIGVDGHDFKPWSIVELIDLMNTKLLPTSDK